MISAATRLWRKARRRLWMKLALRGVSASDNYSRLDMAYAVPDPWNMDSALEQARFAATNRLIERVFGRVGSILEIGCGEGHQTQRLLELADRVRGIDVSEKAVERARERVPQGDFAAGDVFAEPLGDGASRYDLVLACEVLYYMRDPAATIARMRQLGRAGLVTVFAPAGGRIGPHLEAIPNLHKDWMCHGSTAWLAAWWRDE